MIRLGRQYRRSVVLDQSLLSSVLDEPGAAQKAAVTPIDTMLPLNGVPLRPRTF